MQSKKKKFKLWLLGKLIYLGFRFQIPMTHFYNVNKPDTDKQFIIAAWHAHQCGLYGLKEIISKINILISPSNDGQIITNACEDMGYKVIRGSKGRKGSSQAVLQMLDALKTGDDVAVMIDGPRGPKHIVQPGIIELAKLSGIPIIPFIWYSPQKNFLKFNSWDEFSVPLGFCKVVNVYGDPIFVDKDISPEGFEQKRLEVENKLKELYEDAQKNYKEYLKSAK